jgi:hypothetical protein
MQFIKKWLFFLILIFSTTNLFCYEHELAVCAVFKDEAPYMREWVEFHMAQGVQRFYLYDNAGCDFRSLELDDYILCGTVIIIPWFFDCCDCKDFKEICCKAYMHCIHHIKKKVHWCAFLEPTEFLFCPDTRFLNVFLRKYKKYACLCVQRQVFGTSHIEFAPCGQLIRHLFWKCHPKHECCKKTTCIVQPKYVTGSDCPKCFTFKPGYFCVNANKKICKGCKSPDILIDKIRIHHYVYRDLNFYYDLRGRHNCCCFGHEWGFELDLNCFFDDCILKVCPPFIY